MLLPALSEGGPVRREICRCPREELSALEATHWKENGVLFPLVEETLDKAQLDRLHVSSGEHEQRVIDHNRREKVESTPCCLRSRR